MSPWNMGIGGTGYINPPDSTTSWPFKDHIKDLVNKPDVLIDFGGINDES